MSLYRKYRPQSFADVVGQDPVVDTLEQAAKQDKLAHAYLFAGGRGTGKTSVARILAKILMIHNVEDENIRQTIVRGVEEGSSIDLLEIDAASTRGIDDVRDLIEKIQFSPVVSGAKVYIIDEVHMLTKEAFNALLKTLEEPPSYAFFILATTELNKIPLTIQSRCQCFPFRSIGEEEIIRRLQFIADQERITVERDALRAIAHAVQGGMRDAISLLDQLQSLPKITKKDVEDRIGASADQYAETAMEAVMDADLPVIIETIRQVEEAGIALDVFVRKLLAAARQSLHTAIAEKKPTLGIQRALDILLSAMRDLRVAAVPGLVVESALIRLCSPEEEPAASREKGAVFAAPKSTKEKTKAATEKQPGAAACGEHGRTIPGHGESEPGRGGNEPHQETSDIQNAAIEAPDLTLETLRSAWENIIEQTKPASVRMSLKNGQILSLEERRVTVGFASTFHRDKVAHPEASRSIEEIMQTIFKRSLKLECIVGDIHSEEDHTAEQPDIDLAEAAAEVFK
ncbi:MAG: DNA polymerase III subunit gamma/tau [Candidatus Peregrinibacteria bacterium]